MGHFLLVLFIFFGFNSSAYAFFQCIDIFPVNDTVWWDEARYLAPNEEHPEHAKSILDKAPEGIIVSVGAERVLFDFLLKESATTYVVAVDVDPIIIRFHQLNRVLLSITPEGDLLTYQRLRLKPNLQDWKITAQLANDKNWISDEDFAIITNKKNFDWWLKNVTNHKSFAGMHSGERLIPVNYIYNQDQLEKLQQLARGGRYLAYKVDLSKVDAVIALKEFLQEIQKSEVGQGFGISVLDISNAWEDSFPNHYLGIQRMASLLFRLHNSFEENGIILETVVFAQERLAKGSRYQWAYTGYNMPPASLQLTYGFWTKQATFMDSYNFQRQREMISSYLRADENMPWSDLTDLLYY